jgi:2-amino-4-hydroxy-6-hydroxymethyldihydropteridine diphosphokinase
MTSLPNKTHPFKSYIALGSNLGNRRSTLQSGIHQLASHPQIQIIQLSSVYETPPLDLDEEAQPALPFLNMVIEIDTTLSPEQLLEQCLAIEKQHGRIRELPQKSKTLSRTLDLDILFFDELIFRHPFLTLPHPKLHQRAFVLLPLCEIAPALWHPLQNSTVSDCLANLQVESLEAYRNTGKLSVCNSF